MQASVIEFDADVFAEGDYVAVIDCMTFVPEPLGLQVVVLFFFEYYVYRWQEDLLCTF